MIPFFSFYYFVFNNTRKMYSLFMLHSLIMIPFFFPYYPIDWQGFLKLYDHSSLDTSFLYHALLSTLSLTRRGLISISSKRE